MFRACVFSALLAVAAFLLMAAGKNPGYIISFHEEGDANEGEKRVKPLQIGGEMRHFRVSPLFTQSRIEAYWPFRAADGTWGAVFWLDHTANNILQRVGVANRGRLILTAVNRVPVDYLLVDGQPPDNRIVVWRGLSPELFSIIDKEKKIRRVKGGSPELAAQGPAGELPQLTDAPLPEGAVDDPATRAAVEAATADLPLPDQPPPARRPQTGGEPELPEPPFRDPLSEIPRVSPLPQDDPIR